MRKFILPFIILLSSCSSSGGDSAGDSGSNTSQVNYPLTMVSVPSYLESFTTDDKQKQDLYDLLVTMSVNFDSQAALTLYNEILAGDTSTKEISESGCTVKKSYFSVAYINIDCGNYTYEIDYYSSGALRLWYFDYTRTNGFTRVRVYIENNTVTYKSNYIRTGGADLVVEADFIYDGANFYTNASLEYTE